MTSRNDVKDRLIHNQVRKIQNTAAYIFLESDKWTLLQNSTNIIFSILT